MPDVYTRRFFLGALQADWVLLHTASSSEVLRDIEAHNNANFTGHLAIAVQTHSGDAGCWIVDAGQLSPGATLHWDGRVALEATDEIWASPYSGNIGVCVTGYVFQ